jgi:23S rRNA (cytosine1962-C5)-methyltransferase
VALSAVFEQPEFPAYELVDSGAGEKLERYGDVLVRRPDPQALWRPRLDARAWERAALAFERDPASGGQRGRWRASGAAPAALHGERPEWRVAWRGAVALLRPTPFKHLGLFPEQAANWAFIAERIQRAGRGGERPRVLNLFGYTGMASVVAARAGAEVTHVDASKSSIAWARENAAASGLGAEALRVVLEDALAFAQRAARRGEVYQGVLLDPPHHGKGPKGERWQFEEHAALLVERAAALLAPDAFLVLTAYAFGTSPLALAGLLAGVEGELEAGELALREAGGGRLLPCGFCARLVRGRLGSACLESA